MKVENYLSINKEPYMKNKRLSILLAEDNPISSKLAQINISKLGHNLDIVSNGLDAVENYKTKKYDVILMDIEMPIMGGVDATKLIRSYEKDMHAEKPVKIVAMTAHDDDQINYFIQNGMDEYCCKPYKHQDLCRILQ